MPLLPLELLRQVACASHEQEAGRLRRSCVSVSRQVTQKNLVQGYTARLLRTEKVPFKYSLVEPRVTRMSEDVICLMIDLLVKEWGEPGKGLEEEDALSGIFNLVISEGFLRPTRLLLDYGLKWTDASLRPLKTCLDYEQVEILRLLLEGIDIDEEDDGAIAFGAGCTGNADILRVAMPRLNLRNRNYALSSSSRAVKLEGLELLVNSGWRLTLALDNGGFTHELMGGGLAKAVPKGEVDRVELIVRAITNVNWGEQEDKPLFNGIEAGEVRCIRILLDNEASITQARIHEAVWGAERVAIESLQPRLKPALQRKERPSSSIFGVWELGFPATAVDAVAKLKGV
ncbi:hypothetical protein HK104_011021 [Borealophlyctis nickersoniae]|nr:hypothetical protein HK104_011021 [Borealophlyctis nickersoniae]